MGSEGAHTRWIHNFRIALANPGSFFFLLCRYRLSEWGEAWEGEEVNGMRGNFEGAFREACQNNMESHNVLGINHVGPKIDEKMSFNRSFEPDAAEWQKKCSHKWRKKLLRESDSRLFVCESNILQCHYFCCCFFEKKLSTRELFFLLIISASSS